MALGDGTTWDESNPTNNTLAVQIDDYDRDLRVGIRSRLAFEHEFPASQAATAEAGKHKFITLQAQTSKPTLSGTQIGAVYSKTNSLYYEDSGGNETIICKGNLISTFLTGVTDITLQSASYVLMTGMTYSTTCGGATMLLEFNAPLTVDPAVVETLSVAFYVDGTVAREQASRAFYQPQQLVTYPFSFNWMGVLALTNHTFGIYWKNLGSTNSYQYGSGFGERAFTIRELL